MKHKRTQLRRSWSVKSLLLVLTVLSWVILHKFVRVCCKYGYHTILKRYSCGLVTWFTMCKLRTCVSWPWMSWWDNATRWSINMSDGQIPIHIDKGKRKGRLQTKMCLQCHIICQNQSSSLIDEYLWEHKVVCIFFSIWTSFDSWQSKVRQKTRAERKGTVFEPWTLQLCGMP